MALLAPVAGSLTSGAGTMPVGVSSGSSSMVEGVSVSVMRTLQVTEKGVGGGGVTGGQWRYGGRWSHSWGGLYLFIIKTSEIGVFAPRSFTRLTCANVYETS